MGFLDLRANLLRFIVMLLSLSVHEWAHAATAVSLGDDTPERQGRNTLNPMAHIDLVGTVLLPLLGVPFGWAKPVQWNPNRVRRGISMRRASWMVSVAGPLSNAVLALIAAIAYLLVFRFQVDASSPIQPIAAMFLQTNVALAVFNMLPIPPLDGSRIVDANLPRSMEHGWAMVHQYAPFILVLVVAAPPMRRLITVPMELMMQGIVHVASNMVGFS